MRTDTRTTRIAWTYERYGNCQDCDQAWVRLFRPVIEGVRVVLAPLVCGLCREYYDGAGVEAEDLLKPRDPPPHAEARRPSVWPRRTGP